MANFTYTLPSTSHVVSHADELLLLLRDGGLEREELIALVRSGDYFATLATLLDSISNELTLENEAEAAILQKIVDNLLYLGHTHKLVKK